MFVGTRIDEREQRGPSADTVEYREASEHIRKEFGCEYVECSFRTMEGVADVFEEAIRIAIKHLQRSPVRKRCSRLCTLI